METNCPRLPQSTDDASAASRHQHAKSSAVAHDLQEQRAASSSLLATPSSPSPAVPLKPPIAHHHHPWNTKNLAARLAADLVSAVTAGALVAPVISIIDRSIMENASGRSPSVAASIRTSLAALFASPRSVLFSRPSALILLLYGGTYLTANALDTFSSTVLRPERPVSAVSSGPAKFAASSVANVALCMYKDRAFVRMFAGPSAAAVPRPVPLPCYALFTLRDCITIFASFNLPPLLAPYIDARLAADVKRHLSGQTAAQFLAPAAVQFVSTPLHLLGLDLYNRPGRPPLVTWRQRWDAVHSNWLVSSVARICRIVPAFGVGGVVNFKVRRNLMQRLE